MKLTAMRELRWYADVQVHQLAGTLMLVALHRRFRIQGIEPVQTAAP